ncbi:MAG TPA: erythromycin esterase family protein [Thermomicrobiaceae bacterium]|nr:erythromycin esterase family protein [Thermomicrobiaceae bacterium]
MSEQRPIGAAVEAVYNAAQPLQGARDDYDKLLDLIGDAQFALIGEASHGTHDFYQQRVEITKRLISEKGFTAVAVEADWPDAYRVNCYVRGRGQDSNADDALGGFERFPTWMWRNVVVEEFVDWLRDHNEGLPVEQQCGFYGLDLYSLYTSIAEVIRYLDQTDPEAAQRARKRYACLEHFGRDAQAYGYATVFGRSEPCEQEVVNQLVDLQRHRLELIKQHGEIEEEKFFSAEMNARVVLDAEEYYRTMFYGNVASWNLRDSHMADTLDNLTEHLGKMNGQPPKIALWEHNSHLGDARATEMGAAGEWNVGQLVRERHDGKARLIGFTTYTGTVTAASDWDQPAQRKHVRPGLPGSYEDVFHSTEIPRFYLPLRDGGRAAEQLSEPRLERAIGVIYRPETERISHYFLARISDQFDAVIHLDETRALEPLEINAEWQSIEPPETYPFGQ